MRNKDKKYHLLYKTTNVLNGKYYYGIHSTNKVEDGYLGSGKYFRHSLRKYGKENFKREILKQFDNREELVQAEIDLISEDILHDPYNMNIQFGGEGINTTGMVPVRDKDGNIFSVFCDDPRYLSGQLVYYAKDFVTVKDKDGNMFRVHKTDPRYLSGELVSNMKGMVNVRDKDGNSLHVSINDPRYLSGELVGHTSGMVPVRDKDDTYFNVSINDPRYLSGELVHQWTGRKHTDEAKKKMREVSKGKQTGSKNSQFGTCWITKDGENKKIKKELLQSFIDDGWIKGRKTK